MKYSAEIFISFAPAALRALVVSSVVFGADVEYGAGDVWRAASTTEGVISLGRHRKESMGLDGFVVMVKVITSLMY